MVALRIPPHIPVAAFFYPESWPTILALIRSAERCVRIASYTFGSNEVLNALEEPARKKATLEVMAEDQQQQARNPKKTPKQDAEQAA